MQKKWNKLLIRILLYFWAGDHVGVTESLIRIHISENVGNLNSRRVASKLKLNLIHRRSKIRKHKSEFYDSSKNVQMNRELVHESSFYLQSLMTAFKSGILWFFFRVITRYVLFSTTLKQLSLDYNRPSRLDSSIQQKFLWLVPDVGAKKGVGRLSLLTLKSRFKQGFWLILNEVLKTVIKYLLPKKR